MITSDKQIRSNDHIPKTNISLRGIATRLPSAGRFLPVFLYGLPGDFVSQPTRGVNDLGARPIRLLPVQYFMLALLSCGPVGILLQSDKVRSCACNSRHNDSYNQPSSAFGLVRQDERYHQLDIELFTAASSRDVLLDQWSDGMHRLRK